MANELPEVMSGIIDQYGGSVARLVNTARSRGRNKPEAAELQGHRAEDS